MADKSVFEMSGPASEKLAALQTRSERTSAFDEELTKLVGSFIKPIDEATLAQRRLFLLPTQNVQVSHLAESSPTRRALPFDIRESWSEVGVRTVADLKSAISSKSSPLKMQDRGADYRVRSSLYFDAENESRARLPYKIPNLNQRAASPPLNMESCVNLTSNQVLDAMKVLAPPKKPTPCKPYVSPKRNNQQRPEGKLPLMPGPASVETQKKTHIRAPPAAVQVEKPQCSTVGRKARMKFTKRRSDLEKNPFTGLLEPKHLVAELLALSASKSSLTNISGRKVLCEEENNNNSSNNNNNDDNCLDYNGNKIVRDSKPSDVALLKLPKDSSDSTLAVESVKTVETSPEVSKNIVDESQKLHQEDAKHQKDPSQQSPLAISIQKADSVIFDDNNNEDVDDNNGKKRDRNDKNSDNDNLEIQRSNKSKCNRNVVRRSIKKSIKVTPQTRRTTLSCSDAEIVNLAAQTEETIVPSNALSCDTSEGKQLQLPKNRSADEVFAEKADAASETQQRLRKSQITLDSTKPLKSKKICLFDLYKAVTRLKQQKAENGSSAEMNIELLQQYFSSSAAEEMLTS